MAWKWRSSNTTASASVIDPVSPRESFNAWGNDEEFDALQVFGAIDGYDSNSFPKALVTLPVGWTISGPRSGYWYIYDDKGRERGFKCSAGSDCYLVKMAPWLKFSDAQNYELLEVGTVSVSVRNGNGELVCTGTSSPRYIGDASDVHDGYSEARESVVAWLMEHFPEWKSISAYWD